MTLGGRLAVAALLSGLVAPVAAAVDRAGVEPAARAALNARVQAVRQALAPTVGDGRPEVQASPWTNWTNWNNWPKWSKWSNWANA